MDEDLIQIYGFTQKTNTLDYMIVMNYVKDGSLRKVLPDVVKDKWIVKLMKLYSIIKGLNTIHKQKMIHCDLHPGNILYSRVYSKYTLSISDLGLCKPMDQSISKKYDIYGVLPFVAPEVLRGNPYTAASDIYSFSMIMWEFTTGIPPFNNIAHDFHLALSICKGEHPKIIKNTPQCYVNLMKQCWDTDPSKRPKASKVKKIINDWILNITKKDINEESKDIAMEFYKADKVLEQIQTNTSDIISNKSHPHAYHISHTFDFTKKLNEALQKKDQEDMNVCGYENNKNNDELYETRIGHSTGNYYNNY